MTAPTAAALATPDTLSKNDQNLVWIDCEMSGLDPEKERLLEIAVVITGPQLTPRVEGPVIVIHQSEAVLDAMDAWNKGTHGRSGLIDKVRASTVSEAQAEPACVETRGLRMTYGAGATAVEAIRELDLRVEHGEFVCILGPSGSGKSTLLRAIAGLTTIDHGRIVLHGRDVTNVGARQREVGFVFQNYALFRHMSVAENVEFGLRIRKIGAADRRRKRDELLELVGLAGLGGRRPMVRRTRAHYTRSADSLRLA